MCKLFNRAISSTSFPEEMLQAIIVALPKPGKFLANRLAEITPHLIKADQVGFVKGQQAPDGTRRMYNLIKIAETHKVPTVFLTLDAEKAFDRVHWGT